MSAKKRKAGRVVVGGLGGRPPYTCSLNVLHALGRCDLVATREGDAAAARAVAALCRGPRRAVWSGDLAARAAAEARKGRAVGLAFSSSPVLFGGVSDACLRRCREAGVPCEVIDAPSPFGAALAALRRTLGTDMMGVNAYEWRTLERLESVDAEQPLIVAFDRGPLGPGEVAALDAWLSRRYEAGRRAWLLGAEYGEPALELAVGALASRVKRLAEPQLLYVDGRGPASLPPPDRRMSHV